MTKGNCKTCNVSLSDREDCLHCRSCNNVFHLKCIGIPEDTYRELSNTKKRNLKCNSCTFGEGEILKKNAGQKVLKASEPEVEKKQGENVLKVCESQLKSSEALGDFEDSILKKLSEWHQEIMGKMETRLTEFEKKMEKMVNTVEGYSKFFDGFAADMKVMKEDMKKLKGSVQASNDENKHMKLEVRALKCQVQEIKSKLTSTNLEIKGVPHDSVSNVMDFVDKLATVLKVGEVKDTIQCVEKRKGKYGRESIFLKFKNTSDPSRWLNAVRMKRLLKASDIDPNLSENRIYINEDLDHETKQLLYKTKMMKLAKGWHGFWVKNGCIYVRVEKESKPVIILDEGDLNNLK